jgi:catechol 2,3-dioxygenase-like lactoylglutathione lyase family enzyme
MKRFHVHVSVPELDESVRFYSTVFGCGPVVIRPDYARWMLDDPCLNFAISTRRQTAGIDHIGLQVDSAEELTVMRGRLGQADAALVEQAGAACCYARADKYWVTDPSGIAWETFHSYGTTATFGEMPSAGGKGTTCCVPVQKTAGGGCC